MASPTFEAVGFYANATKAEVVKVPLAASYAHQLVAMGTEAQKNPGLVYICNPNNPTGSVTPRRSLENFIRELPKNCYVLMDEAYHDFVTVSADYSSFIDHPVNDDRVIVARTFSKIFGMAGLRLGYAVASPATAKLLRTTSSRTASTSSRSGARLHLWMMLMNTSSPPNATTMIARLSCMRRLCAGSWQFLPGQILS